MNITPAELQQLEASLWEAADQLRANSKLNATEYSMPVLGLIFLRHATNRFESIQADIAKTLPTRGGKTRPISRDDFKGRAAIFLQEAARYDFLAALPADKDLGATINEAMRLIEAESEMLTGVLPKDYNRFEKKLLEALVRIFNREVLRTATGDIFGRIYEYFLNKFAMSGAQEGGEFFTPPSLVRTIVNVIEPNHGIVLDPACGSAGMIVQTGHFIEALSKSPGAVATFYGQEKSETNSRLARMNLAVHGLQGDVRIGNTFYDRWDELVGECAFVMANPPFNVDGVDPTRIAGDPRLWTKKKIPGITKAKKDGKGQKPPGVSNANYLWIQYFQSYLNKSGRAGFVMASSATDAGHGEQEIRKEIVESGELDVIIAIGSNFFYTRTLPCTLWFFDKGKPKERKKQVLMIDARNIYRVISRKVRDFSDEQLANITAIVWLYRGETERYLELVRSYFERAAGACTGLATALQEVDAPSALLSGELDEFLPVLKKTKNVEDDVTETLSSLVEERANLLGDMRVARKQTLDSLKKWCEWLGSARGLETNKVQIQAGERLAVGAEHAKSLAKLINDLHKTTNRVLDVIEKGDLGTARDAWDSKCARKARDELDAARFVAVDALKRVQYLAHSASWLQSKFPKAEMAAVQGLCKVVSLAEIEGADWSLAPGRHVGISAEILEEDEIFDERIRAIHAELLVLQDEASELSTRISANIEELLD